jgi:ornithine cyclodeaminase/alanine dehydrogenase-like protein (mu-crystallin family)
MVILVRDQDVKNLIEFKDVIEKVEDAYLQYGKGLAGCNSLYRDNVIIPRCDMRTKGKRLPHISKGIEGVHQDMAYLEEDNAVFIRWSFKLGNKTGSFPILIDVETGDILAIFKAPIIQWMRTGAAGAVGAKYLSREDSELVGCIGTGRQGRSQLEALSNIRKISFGYSFSGRRKDEKFASEMSDKLGINIVASNNIEEVVTKSDILISATRSTSPIIKGKLISKGQHINAIGADCPKKAELDPITFKKANKIVIDYYLSLHTKDLFNSIKHNYIDLKDIYANIGEIVANKKPGREREDEITIYKNTGMCLPYVSINKMIYNKIIEKGAGIEVSEDIFKLIYE